MYSVIGILLFLTFQVYIADLLRYQVDHVICNIDQNWGLVLLLFLWVLLGSYIYIVQLKTVNFIFRTDIL